MTTNDQPQTIPADKVRNLRDQYARLIEDAGTKEAQAYYGHVVDDLEALLPAPPRPTLADMTREERDGCRWMQADVEGDDSRVVILVPDASVGRALLLDREPNLRYAARDEVTPRPDLPRMTWPGTEKPAPAHALPDGWRLADHPNYGLVVVTSGTPDEGGLVAFVHRDDDLHRGHGYDWCKPAELTFIDSPTTKGAGQ